MPLFHFSSEALHPVSRTSFREEQLLERQDIQRLLRDRLEAIDSDLLLIAEEYSAFEDSRRRIYLLALDRSGSLVVIEIKRDDDGGHMELQALRYAAMVSTMTFQNVVDQFSSTNDLAAHEAEERILDWVGRETLSLDDRVRIILVAADFSTEITSTVLWLTTYYALDISCVRIAPYRFQNSVLIDIQRVIPLPVADDYRVRQVSKVVADVAARQGSGKDYTKYDIHDGTEWRHRLSKQAAIRTAIIALFRAGITPATLQDTLTGMSWYAVERERDESVEDAFSRSYPMVSSLNKWFDTGISAHGTDWVVPRFGGPNTEAMLDALKAIAPESMKLGWRRTPQADASA